VDRGFSTRSVRGEKERSMEGIRWRLRE